MTRKADFNAEEWSLLTDAPPTVGLRVVTADRGGTIRESLQMGKVYAEARQDQPSSDLLDDIVSEQPTIDPREFKSVDEIREHSTRRLRDALALLEQKASPEDIEAYRQFVLNLAQRVAAAHKEGGVLGIGGKEISEEEQAAIDEITAAAGGAPAE